MTTAMKTSDRGFLIGEWIEGSYDDRTRVTESSVSGGPYIWIWVQEDPCTCGQGVKAGCQLDIEGAKRLRGDLNHLIMEGESR